MRLLCILFAGALTLAPLFARADDAATLLAKHRAFVGWQFGDGTFRTLVLSGDVVHGGKKVIETRKILAGAVKRVEDKDLKHGWTTQSGFTGHVYWASDENGFTRPELGDVQRYLIASDLTFNEAASELSGKIVGSANVDGSSTTIVRVTPENADTLDLYIDPATGAYKRVVLDPRGTYETTWDILAYADALPGKKLISKYKEPGSDYLDEWTKFIPNAPIAAADVHPPAQTATWTFASGNPFPIKLAANRIFIDAKVNGVPGRFILDTGDGGGVLLKQQFADRAHVKATGSIVGYGFGGSANESTVRIDALGVGGNTLHNLYATSQRFDYNTFQDADGLIGFDLLAGAVVSLDLGSQTMTIKDPATTPVDSNKGLLAVVDLTQAIPRLPMKLDNIDVNVELDSGTPDLIVYGHDLVFKYGLRTLSNPNWEIGGIGGTERVACGTLDSLSVGPIVYRSPFACESGDFDGREALVGLDFMRHFNWVFDYPHAQIIIIPRNDQ